MDGFGAIGHRLDDIQLVRKSAPRRHPRQMLCLINEDHRRAAMLERLLRSVLQSYSRPSWGRGELTSVAALEMKLAGVQFSIGKWLLHLFQHSVKVIAPAEVAALRGYRFNTEVWNAAGVSAQRQPHLLRDQTFCL